MPTTPGNDPIDSLSQPRAAAAPRSSGPHRTPRSSPSPSPYGRGGETPRASRMSSASDAALRQGRSRSSPPRSTPGSHRGASPISLGGGPDDDDMGDDDPPLVGSSQFDRDLTYNANWLRLLDPTEVANFDDFDKEAIARGLTAVITAAEAAGVIGWRDPDLDSRLRAVAEGYFPSPTATHLGDVAMTDAAPLGPARGPPRRRADPPRGARPLPRPPGGRGGKPSPIVRGPPPMVNRDTRPGSGPVSYAQAARLPTGQMGSSSLEGVVRLAKAFPELPTQRLLSMEKAAGDRKQKPKKASATVHGPSRRQVLITMQPPPVAGVDPSSLLTEVKRTLSLHHSTLEAQSVSEAYGGFSVAMDRVATDAELGFIREGTRAAFPSATRVEAALPSSTSYIKLVDVPYFIGENTVITPEVVVSRLSGAGLSSLAVLSTPPRVVRDSRMSDTATVYLNIADSVSGARSKALLGRSVQFGRFVCPFRAARANPGAALCTRCWRWGHPSQQCRAPQIRCPACSGPHRKEHHRTLAGCCKGNANATPPVPPTAPGEPCPHPFRCPNCHKGHAADDRRCNFWRHRFDQEWIKARYAEVRAASRTRSPLTHHPAAGGGRP